MRKNDVGDERGETRTWHSGGMVDVIGWSDKDLKL